MARSVDLELTTDAAVEAATQIQRAANAKKCWTCGCFHGTVSAIERAFPGSKRPDELVHALQAARARLEGVRYDCLGCEVCYPALAANALSHAMNIDSCPTEKVVERPGWPPLPGTYRVLRYSASVAVCTLADEPLARAVAESMSHEIAIVGTLLTENLGIERLVLNVLANPHIRFLVLCGADSHQAIGHLPGQSLVALGKNGVDERQRICGAAGKRPVLRNLARPAIDHFRETVTVIDLVGTSDPHSIAEHVRTCVHIAPGPAVPFDHERTIHPTAGWLPHRMTPDPAGYFVVYADPARGISLEHYRNDGLLDNVIEGRSAAELYIPAIEQSLVTRLDHAAYLGRELGRAEIALRTGQPYIQDAAPERPLEGCGCATSCKEVLQ